MINKKNFTILTSLTKIYFIIPEPVTLMTSPLRDVIVRDAGKEISLPCNVEGEPEPIINWFFNEQLGTYYLFLFFAEEKIKNFNPQKFQNLFLERHNLSEGPSLTKVVSALDAGTYTCRAFQKILQTRDVEIKYEVKVRRECGKD